MATRTEPRSWLGIDAPTLAILFHDTYERLAPGFGYATRAVTRQFDPESPNGRLMIATCGAILEKLARTREGLRAAHGTPEEFERAVWEAHGQLFCTTDEATAAIQKYREEYAASPEERNDPMGNENVKIAVCSSIMGKDGKYGAMIHTSDGRVLVEPDLWFDTVDEAKAAGTAMLSKGMELMQEQGYKAHRPGSPESLFAALAPEDPVDIELTLVYVPAAAGAERASQGLFVVEHYGPLPADFRIYTLLGFFDDEQRRVWKESPDSVEWLFEMTRKGKVDNLNDPAVFARLNTLNASLVRLLIPQAGGAGGTHEAPQDQAPDG